MIIPGGIFITIEGGEGSGKSIASAKIFEYLEEKKIPSIITREPGGTECAEAIRKILLIGKEDKIDAVTESLLYLAARADHWNSVILPNLQAGKVVVCDRFHDSSVVYQGICKGVDIAFLNNALKTITKGRSPDRTYLLDVPAEIGVMRSFSRNGNIETRFENMPMDFHKNVRTGFLDLAKKEPNRFVVINSNSDVDSVFSVILHDFQQILQKKLSFLRNINEILT